MGYEPNRDYGTTAPPVSLPGGGGEWEGQGPLSTSGSPEAEFVKAAIKETWNAYQPIRWQDESGMQAVTQTQKTVVVPVKITKKPRGSWINTKYGTIQPGDVVVEVARGTASGTPNSYVMWGGISGWVRTGELKNLTAVTPAIVTPVTVTPAYSRTNGGVDWVPSDYTGAGQEITPELTALLKKRREDIAAQTRETENGAAQPAKKLPVLPIAAIGYFLLNR